MKRIGLLSLALVLALGTMGVGLAQWTETLTITGNANIGNLSVTFQDEGCADNETTYDVADCTVSVTGKDTDNETLTVTITNAYPCYTCTVAFEVLNDGSVPVDLDDMDFSGVPSQLGIGINHNTATEDLAVGSTKAGCFDIHVETSAGENANYTFSIPIAASQFNY